jgi:hypothetical protein
MNEKKLVDKNTRKKVTLLKLSTKQHNQKKKLFAFEMWDHMVVVYLKQPKLEYNHLILCFTVFCIPACVIISIFFVCCLGIPIPLGFSRMDQVF